MPQIPETIDKQPIHIMMDPDEAEGSFMELIHLSRDKPRMLVKKDSLGSAKQISVDPISLKESSSNQQSSSKIDLLIPRQPPRSKLVSQSLPNSTLSSLRICSDMSIKKCKHQSQPLVLSVMSPQDCVTLANVDRLLKSKSCGEGRASEPPEGFGLYLSKVDNVKHKHEGNHNRNDTDCFRDENKKDMEENMDMDEKFKCKALCLYLPSFNNKAKAVKAKRQVSYISQSKESGSGYVVSKRVSLEKFECASWNSSNLINEEEEEEEEEDASNFFDLPLEMIRCSSANDTDSPVTTAFVFDKEPRPFLKNNSVLISAARKSNESVGHVRFSTSYPASPTFCFTPSLHKAQDDFNSFLEAQSG